MGDFSIQISSELVNRLANDGETLKKKPRRIKPKKTQESSHPQTEVNEKLLHHDDEANKGNSSAGLPVQSPFFSPMPLFTNAEMYAIKSVIDESERVLERLQKKEDIMVKEVTERAKDLRDKEFKLPYQKPMPCLADYDACRKCYKENANDILKCASLTRSYYECVRRVKQQVSLADK